MRAASSRKQNASRPTGARDWAIRSKTIWKRSDESQGVQTVVDTTSYSPWAAGLQLEEAKTLLRHENIVTTSDVYGDLGIDAKRRIQKRLVAFVTQQAKDQGAKHETDWRQDA